MINISKDQFNEKRKENKVFSLITEYRGDEVTPIRIFNGFKGRRKFIFESGSTENYFGRYSYLGENPYKEILGESIDDIDELKKSIRLDFDESTNDFSFKGGAIGYMGYETICLYEKRLKFNNPDILDLPLIRFNLYSRYICYDHFTHKVFVIDNILNDDPREYESIVENQREYIFSLLSRPTNIEEFEEKKDVHFELCTSKEKYEENVRIGKEHILAGDIFQFVPSLRMKCITQKSFVEIYRRLREVNPSPYMYLIDYDDYQVIGASPESVVSVKNGRASTKPIAGTRKRGETQEEDSALEKELLQDKKELAEHVMLVDLARNDIGRISEIGTVEVKDFMKIEKFSHVMHITSTVTGKTLQNIDGFEALSTCLPAGTLSGAPKIRAMEIIEELEEYRRDIYGGSVGYFSYGGDTDMAIAIRTIVMKGNTAYLQAGAGVVFDSVPEKEFEEVQNKLMALKEALR
ncbi:MULTISPECIES: anthranilate synthase component I family protein [Clostridium]|jgi:anthranilate synthase component 1|uniref:Anthranilate synthase component 1 n=1 Tax=Clostridium butyricum TaxID=1492 RepID=A0A3R9F968_CLOBU|nr:MULTISPECIES: chorismate-binding protein [Clostridium]ALP90476.1 anthranilate synthase subunit I [Clostridium butyricum]ALS16979.1 anthranilate synthase subunit I [Clostridium butyricum]ANF14096.1 anthranilate synthase subunit I [Clostridium butyricum]AOR94162.1 anthranilate synthase subunit I [Clostridium butyricum]AXB84937.1 anthranilate synthase component I [Clostridium butyricum]